MQVRERKKMKTDEVDENETKKRRLVQVSPADFPMRTGRLGRDPVTDAIGHTYK